MSYIIRNNSPFFTIKVTEKGREKIASGNLNFSFWAIGDSEVNYDDHEALLDDGTLAANHFARILKPKDRQPDLKYFLTKDGTTSLNQIQGFNTEVIKAVVNNAADSRGFFSQSGSTFTTYSSSTYTISSQNVSNSQFSGGTTLSVTGLTYTPNDLLLVKLTNSVVTGQTDYSTSLAIPHLWYRIETGTTTDIVVDRELPNLSGHTGDTQLIVYPQGELWDIYGTSATPYWNSGTLSFDSCCQITCEDIPVWNMNNVWCENLAGLSGSTNTHEQYYNFGSYDYIGQKYPYLWYPCSSESELTDSVCDTPGVSRVDDVKKSISIIHYTNNSISNVYGEFFYVDQPNNKTFRLDVPTLMYHRNNTLGTGNQLLQGMSFIASGDVQTIPNSEIEYHYLMEDPTIVSSPKAVGKVFPQLKIATIDDDEIVMAMSYKGNRNWTLPPLSANLVSPSSGNGILDTDETIYITYLFDNDVTGSTTGLTTSMPCQYYTKLTNTTPTPKNVSFHIDGLDQLPYMRKVEDPGYDGLGFYGREFKVLWQIVSDVADRPISDQWNVHDFTSTAITANANETIDPLLLENQDPAINGFTITETIATGATIFDIPADINAPLWNQPTNLQFGDERFFYGNVNSHIGATIFKTLFKLNVAQDEFIYTSNPTRDNTVPLPPDLRVSEVGIYDSDRNLVVVGKASRPVKLINGATITMELSIDF